MIANNPWERKPLPSLLSALNNRERRGSATDLSSTSFEVSEGSNFYTDKGSKILNKSASSFSCCDITAVK